jgi:AraC-like DNA-binding protein
MLLFRPPTAALAPYIESLWYCGGYPVAHRRERVLPNGRFQLIVDLSDGFLRREHGAEASTHAPAAPIVVGLQSSYSVLETAALQSLVGAVFWPGGIRALFDVPADNFRNLVVPVEMVWGARLADDLRDCVRDEARPSARLDIFEAALFARLRAARTLHPAVRHALRCFRQAAHIQKVTDVARDAGLSRRRFATIFSEQIGLTPKLYCRIRRFQHVVRQIGLGAPVDWAAVAAAGGYYDQAHLANEFRDFAGITPGTYAASGRVSLNHVPIE